MGDQEVGALKVRRGRHWECEWGVGFRCDNSEMLAGHAGGNVRDAAIIGFSRKQT